MSFCQFTGLSQIKPGPDLIRVNRFNLRIRGEKNQTQIQDQIQDQIPSQSSSNPLTDPAYIPGSRVC